MFYRLKESLRRFMYGRYGTDTLNNFMCILLVILAAVNWFFGSGVVYLIQWLLLLAIVLRAISKNYYKRSRENSAFLKIYNPIKNKYKMAKQRFAQRKYRVYRTCPACKATISLPKKKGKHGVRCPKCRHEFKVRILF